MIDPGHGGWDPGSTEFDGRSEASWTWPMSKALGDHLSSRYDVQVLYTHQGSDTSLATPQEFPNPDVRLARELQRRAQVANDAHADLLISMHHDASGSPQVRGASLYIWTDRRAPDGGLVWLDAEGNHRAPRSYAIASQVVPALKDALAARGIPWRGFKTADFGVLRAANCPCMLIEWFEGTSPDDLRIARDPAFISGMAATLGDALARAIGIPARTPAVPVPVTINVTGVLRGNTTYVAIDGHEQPVRAWAAAHGFETVNWIPADQGGPRVTVSK